MHTQSIQKVAIVIDTAFIGGPGKGIIQLLRNQQSNRYSYVVFAFSYRKPKSTEFIDAVRSAGHDIRLLPQRFNCDPTAIFEAIRIARQEKVALVQSHGYKSHLVAMTLSKYLNMPWFAMTHGWTNENWKIRLYRHLERFLLKRADVAGTVSPPLFNEIVRLRGIRSPSRLILNAVDIEDIEGDRTGTDVRVAFSIPANRTVLGVFGRLSPEKGVLEVLEAFQLVNQEQSHLVLMYVGDGPQRSELTQRMTELGIERKVIFAGYQEKMLGFYKAIDILVIPSLSEGLPNVMLEAMAVGIPVISTRVGAIPDVIQHGKTGWLVDPGDMVELAQQVCEVAKVPSQWQAVSQAALNGLYPRYSALSRADAFAAVYDELLTK